MTFPARHPPVVGLCALLAVGCASAPSGNTAAEPASSPSAPGIAEVDARGLLDRAILQAARVLRFSAEGRSDPVWVLIDLGYRRR